MFKGLEIEKASSEFWYYVEDIALISIHANLKDKYHVLKIQYSDNLINKDLKLNTWI